MSTSREAKPVSNVLSLRPADGSHLSMMRYEAACRAVAEARTVDEAMDLGDRAEALRVYARQARNKQLEIDASEIRFRAERRVGVLIAGQREIGALSSGGRPSETGLKTNPVLKPPSLAEIGIDKRLADRARRYAALPAPKFEEILADRRNRIETENRRVTVNLLEVHHRVTLNTGENEWYTPSEYLDRARLVLGQIDLDPASCAVANATVAATRIYTQADDGLKMDWTGQVWMNPPYAQPLIAQFADKLVTEFAAGRVTAAIVLTNDCTDTTWFHKLARRCTALCFARGRIRFVSPRGDRGTPTQGQTFFYFGENTGVFIDVFEAVGFVIEMRRNSIAGELPECALSGEGGQP